MPANSALLENRSGGAVTFIQRFGSALNLNLHFHMLCIDGVYAADDDDRPQFQVLLAPDDEEVARLTATLAERIAQLLVWDRIAIRRRPIRCPAINRGWLAFMPHPYRAESPSARTPDAA